MPTSQGSPGAGASGLRRDHLAGSKAIADGSLDGKARSGTPPTVNRSAGSCCTARVTATAFSSDGKALTGSDDGTVRLWDAETGKPLPVTLRHRGQVLAASLSPDGTRILTSAYFHSGAQLWHARLGKRIGLRYEDSDTTSQVVFSPDGRTALLGGYDGWAVLWHLPAPIEGDVERIVCWIKTEVGMELDSSGGHRVLECQEWLKLQGRLQGLGARGPIDGSRRPRRRQAEYRGMRAGAAAQHLVTDARQSRHQARGFDAHRGGTNPTADPAAVEDAGADRASSHR
jgi:hypothetical protein